jgi:hypothetical protein
MVVLDDTAADDCKVTLLLAGAARWTGDVGRKAAARSRKPRRF